MDRYENQERAVHYDGFFVSKLRFLDIVSTSKISYFLFSINQRDITNNGENCPVMSEKRR